MEKILMVDDEDIFIPSLRILFNNLGYELNYAPNGEEALTVARNEPPVLIISDIQMPVMDGFELCHQWHQDDNLKDIPFVFFSATYNEPENIEFALNIGADKFIPKDTDIDVFSSLIQEIIQKFKSGDLAINNHDRMNEFEYYKNYSETLIRKLEDKMVALTKVNKEQENLIEIHKRTLEELHSFKIAAMSMMEDADEARKEVEEINKELNKKISETISLAHELEIKNQEQEAQNVELMIAKEQAEAANKLKTAFLANMSHEIRTPMIGIIGFSRILSEGNLSKNEKKEYAEEMNKSSKRLLDLLNNIILTSQLETGHIELELSEFNLNNLIDEVYSTYLESANKNKIGLNVSIELRDDDSNINSDEDKITQILSNLISNALKFTSNGSISFGYHLLSNEFEFFVKDTGIGISKEFLPKVFELFSQEDTALNRSYEGSGIGLTIVRNYVDLLGGRIWAESEKGKGSTFYFTIPKICT
ncbi:MAG: ATP-binding protein [Candidatus Kapabacteria bacterium]|nr:ATP-binding protein [Candidatus Kapabacteria bacterium]